MGLKGSVRALSLEQLLEFLSASSHAGTLKIAYKDKVCVLCIKDGLIYIDQRGKGEFRLGEVLIQRGVVTQKQIDDALQLQQERKVRIGEALKILGYTEQAQLDAALRAQLEEELYDLFVLDDAYFEFERGLPEGFEARALPAFGTRSILMEAARRLDEWRHIKSTITSRKCFYTLNTENPTAHKSVSKSLSASGADGGQDIFGHERSLEEALPLLGMAQFQGLSVLAHLISEGLLVPFTRAQLETRFREYLVSDIQRALKYYECALELDDFKSRQRQLDKMLFQAEGFGTGSFRYSATIKGKRALQLLVSHFRQDVTCEFYAREDERELRVILSPHFLVWRNGASQAQRKILDWLQTVRLITRNDVLELKAHEARSVGDLEERLLGSGKIDESNWFRAIAWSILDALFDLVFWKNPFVQIQTGDSFDATPMPGDLALETEDWLREEITNQVKEWERVTQVIPSVRSFFELTPKGERAITSPADDMRLFDGRRSLEQIMRLLRRDAQEFFTWLHEQHQGGRIRALEVTDYRRRVETALEKNQIREALAYCAAAVDAGWQTQYFKDISDRIVERHGEGTEERQPARLEGDLASFSLAEVLQSFHMSKRSGTLRIFVEADQREKEVFFEEGQIFLLEIEDDSGDFLLDAGFMAGLNSTFEGKAVASGLISEDELSEQLAEQIKEAVYDVFLWDGARFEFTRDELPPEFYESSTRVTKYSLNTGIFLMEAIRRISEWDQIREVVPNDDLVVKFDSYETKMRAVTERGTQEVLLLIDGRHTITDILRISGARRFHAVALVADLLRSKLLEIVDVTAEITQAPQERAGEVDPESFVQVLRSLMNEKVTGVLRVTDGRKSKECAFVQGAPHRTDAFKHGTGDLAFDRDLSTRFFARDFSEVLVYSNARYQLLNNVLPPILEDLERRPALEVDVESFESEFVEAGRRWRDAIATLDREQPLAWRDEGAPLEAQSIPVPAMVHEFIDGNRTAEDIIRIHPDGRYLAFMALAELFAQGVLKVAENTGGGDDWDFGLD